MKNSTFYFGFIFIVFFLACRKENNLTGKQQSQNSFFDSSVQYLKSQLSIEDFSKLNLANKKVLRYHGDNIGVQIFEKNESSKKYLILKKEATGFSGNWIDMTGLKVSKGTMQSGTVELESINNDSHVSLQIIDNKVINVVETGNSLQRSGTYPNRSKSYSRTKVEVVELPEIVVNGASSGQDFTSLFWLFEEDYAYEDMYFQGGGAGDGSGEISSGGGGGSGGGSSQDNVIAAPTFLPPSNPIADIKNEVKCFSNNASSTYSISVNVNEPSPGTREVFSAFCQFSCRTHLPYIGTTQFRWKRDHQEHRILPKKFCKTRRSDRCGYFWRRFKYTF